MATSEAVDRGSDVEDFGAREHLAAIERMHREALAQIALLAQSWAQAPGAAGEADEGTQHVVRLAGKPPVRSEAA